MDTASGFKALTDGQLLKQHKITLKIGDVKNKNENLVVERAVQELESELLCDDPLGGPVSPLALVVATANLSACIWSHGLSAREVWTQQNQFTNHQIPLQDQAFILCQHEQCLVNHPHSEKSKSIFCHNH